MTAEALSGVKGFAHWRFIIYLLWFLWQLKLCKFKKKQYLLLVYYLWVSFSQYLSDYGRHRVVRQHSICFGNRKPKICLVSKHHQVLGYRGDTSCLKEVSTAAAGPPAVPMVRLFPATLLTDQNLSNKSQFTVSCSKELVMELYKYELSTQTSLNHTVQHQTLSLCK